MAHLLKFKQSQVSGIIAHCTRTKGTGDNVDKSLSKNNIYYKQRSTPSWDSVPLLKQYRQQLAKLKVQKRADVNTLASWVITLPPDIDSNNKQERERFFKYAVAFIDRRYSDAVMLGACVHLDEPAARPHMHFLMIPAVKEYKRNKTGQKEPTGRLKVSAKELFTKQDLKSFHADLSAYMSKVMGREVAVYRDGFTSKRGNRTISQLKLDTVADKLTAKMKNVIEDDKRLKEREHALDSREQYLNALQAKIEHKNKRLTQLLTAVQNRIDRKINETNKQIELALQTKKPIKHVIVRKKHDSRTR